MCFALALLAWLPASFGAGFSFDDREAIEHNGVIEGTLPVSAAFERDYWAHRQSAGHFRPLASLTLRMDRALWGEWAAGFHLTNVLLHGMVVFLAALLLRRLAPFAGRWPWIGLCILALHPVLADSVAWISGRSSMLAALPGLSAALLLVWSVRHRDGLVLTFGLALCGTGLSILGKEDGVLWALALPWIAASGGRRALAASALGALSGLVAALLLRAHALGSPWIEALSAPLADVPLYERLLVGGRGFVEALRLSVWPVGYPPSYSGDAQLAIDTLRTAPLLGAIGLFAWLSALLISLLALYKRRDALAACTLLACLAWFPFLQIVPSGEVFAPRFLYLPMLFAIPLLQRGFELAFAVRLRQVALLCLIVLCVGAWTRARVYASRGAFWQEVLDQRPSDSRAWNDLGLWHEEQRRLPQARLAFERSAQLDPRFSRPWSNLGRLELLAGNTAEATVLLERAAREGPNNPVAWVNLGSARLLSGDASGAEAAQRAAIRLAPGLAKAWEGLARALRAQGRTQDAREALLHWLQLEPQSARALALLEDS